MSGQKGNSNEQYVSVRALLAGTAMICRRARCAGNADDAAGCAAREPAAEPEPDQSDATADAAIAQAGRSPTRSQDRLLQGRLKRSRIARSVQRRWSRSRRRGRARRNMRTGCRLVVQAARRLI